MKTSSSKLSIKMTFGMGANWERRFKNALNYFQSAHHNFHKLLTQFWLRNTNWKIAHPFNSINIECFDWLIKILQMIISNRNVSKVARMIWFSICFISKVQIALASRCSSSYTQLQCRTKMWIWEEKSNLLGNISYELYTYLGKVQNVRLDWIGFIGKHVKCLRITKRQFVKMERDVFIFN